MKEYLINEEINSDFVRLKNTNELISLTEAIKKAKNANTDLIELSTYTEDDKIISICVLQDYQKFIYQQNKREKELKAKQVKCVIKELRFGPRTDEHDYSFKLKHAIEFIKSKNKVKACVIFKGREILFKEQGEKLLFRLASDLNDIAKIESTPKLEGNRMCITLVNK